MSRDVNQPDPEHKEASTRHTKSKSDDLLTIAYDELRLIAASVLGRQSAGNTLQPTALVHELYLRLAKRKDCQWQDHAHFLAIAAMAMRQILIDHARRKGADKRGGGWRRVTLSKTLDLAPVVDMDLVTLNDALESLAQLHVRQARIVELRFLAGMTIPEVAHVLDVSQKTVKDDWRMARAWLMQKLSEGE